jgi:crotonobetainyl-CoA:carnitine CoA-transferase CaiB-like acyl-CoA transferase
VVDSGIQAGDEAPDPVVAWAQDLLAALGRHRDATLASRVDVTGADPVLATRFRVGQAAAAALVAVGAASDELWARRGGRPQRLAIDVRAAAASLLSFALQRAPGLDLARAAPPTVALYRTRDGGWVHLHGGFPHLHEGTLAELGCADDAEAIARAVAARDAQELEDALAGKGMCGARLRSAGEWRAHPQGLALGRVPVVELLRIGDADPTPVPGPPARDAGARPLSGVRVLDLTRVLAGPTCARTLAEHGADVLHVRSPHLPSIEPFVIDTNPGKRSAYLDLDRAEDAARLRELVRGADVFSQGYRGGAFARRGFSPEELAARRPGIVVASIDCYGHDGPWATRPGWEQLAQTATGMAHEHGGTENASIVPAAVTDYTTGHLAALGVLVALALRARDGGSWHVRVSLARTAMWVMSLPRTPEGATPSGLDPAVVAAHQLTMETAWGPLTRLGPVLRMSETPPRWALPPAPLGTHAAQWSGA